MALNLYALKKAAHTDPQAAEVLGDYYEEQGDSATAKEWRKEAHWLHLEAKHPEFTIERIYLNSGGYTSGGKYFGQGEPLFNVSGEVIGVTGSGRDKYLETVNFYIRARDRRDAIAKVELKYPEAKIRGGSLKHRKYAKRKLY